MTDILDNLIAGMLDDVKKGKHKAPRKKQPSGQATSSPTPVINHWTDEALVLVAHSHECLACGNTSTSWEPHLFIERVNTRLAKPVRQLERLGTGYYSAAYGALPKRIEYHHHTSPACPQCFGIGDNQGGALTGDLTPVQLILPLEKCS